MSSKPIAPLDLILADSLLSEEERAVRETVRTYLQAAGDFYSGRFGDAQRGFVAAARAGMDALVTPEQAAQALETALWIEEASGVAVPRSQTRAAAGR